MVAFGVQFVMGHAFEPLYPVFGCFSLTGRLVDACILDVVKDGGFGQ